MRILQVAHGFPPDQMAGAEVYTWTVSREMARRGHDVRVFTASQRASLPHHAIVEEEVDGLAVTRFNQLWHATRRLERTYRDPEAERAFVELARRVKPDVVHVQHTIGLSSQILPLARSLGIPVVMTLHDFWFHCARGQRFTPRQHVCARVQPWRCSLCIAGRRAIYAKKWLGATLRGATEETRGEGLFARGLRLAPRLAHYVAEESFTAPITRRLESMRSALLAANRLLAPSRFLLERFVEQGIPRERLEFSEYGMDDSPFRAAPPRAPRASDAPLRFGFVGTLMPTKGPDLLVRAFQDLPAGAATLDLFGAASGPSAASYEAELRASNRHPGLTFRGRFDNRRIAEVLGSIDVLVVPSRWYENAPLTIHEAVMAKIPFVTSGHGGMTELAERFGNGLLFRPNDSTDLGRVLRRFLEEPDLIAQLQPRRPVRSVADDVDGLLARFEALASRR